MLIKENFLTKILAEGILHIFERELIVMGILIEGVPNEINIQLLLDLLKNKINKEVNIAYLTQNIPSKLPEIPSKFTFTYNINKANNWRDEKKSPCIYLDVDSDGTMMKSIKSVCEFII